MTTPPRRLRLAATQPTCTGCGPDVGFAAHGGRRDVEQRQLRFVT